jgi:hypothetical protein
MLSRAKPFGGDSNMARIFKVPTTPSLEAEFDQWKFSDFERLRALDRKFRRSALKRYNDRMHKDEALARALILASPTEADFVQAVIKAVEREYRDEAADCGPAALEAERKLEEAAKVEKARKDRRLQRVRPLLTRMQYRVFELKLDGLEDSEIATVLCTTIEAVRQYRYEYRRRLAQAAVDGCLD